MMTASKEGPARETLSADRRVAGALRAFFQQSPYAAIRQVDCDVVDGVAILSGSVPTYHTRQLAITLARSVAGVRSLDDRIQVRPALRPSR